MNLSIDRKCRIDGFMYGDFYLEFKFSRRDEDFMVLACLYHPKENGPVEDLHEKVHTARQKITDKSIRLIQTDDGGIVLRLRRYKLHLSWSMKRSSSHWSHSSTRQVAYGKKLCRSEPDDFLSSDLK
jgi:hypothetical protein